MKHLKNLTLSFILMTALAVVAVGSETNSSPCAPGQLETPPCSSAPAGTTDSTDPGETSTPSNAVELTTIVEAVQLALSLI